MDAPSPGSIGGTFVGNPLAIQSALAVIDVIEGDNLLERASWVGEIVLEEFERLKKKHEIVGDVRGLGAMNAIELVRDEDTREPAPEITEKVVQYALEERVILPVAGLHENVLRLLTPLVIEEENLERGLAVIGRAIARAEKETD